MVLMDSAKLATQKQPSDTIGDMFDDSQNNSSDGVGPSAFEAQGNGAEDLPINIEHAISIDSSGLDDLSKKANI